MKVWAFFPLLSIFAMVACDHTSPAGNFTGTPPIRIAGAWTYAGGLSDTIMASCQLNGTAILNQTNDQFTGLLLNGVQVCLYGGERYEDPLYGPVTAGEIAGESVRFMGAGCLHMGTISGSPANHMVGVFNCSFEMPPGTRAHAFSGTWEANR